MFNVNIYIYISKIRYLLLTSYISVTSKPSKTLYIYIIYIYIYIYIYTYVHAVECVTQKP